MEALASAAGRWRPRDMMVDNGSGRAPKMGRVARLFFAAVPSDTLTFQPRSPLKCSERKVETVDYLLTRLQADQQNTEFGIASQLTRLLLLLWNVYFDIKGGHIVPSDAISHLRSPTACCLVPDFLPCLMHSCLNSWIFTVCAEKDTAVSICWPTFSAGLIAILQVSIYN